MSIREIEKPRQRSVRRGLSAGARTGVVAALAGAAAHLAVASGTGRNYDELTVVSVVLVSVFALTVGGAIYSVLAERLRRPQAVFASMAAVAAAAETAAASTRGGGFLFEATVLHLVVATIAVVLIPRLYAGRA